MSKDRREPLLEELLTDPLVHLIMKRDGIEPEQVRRLCEDIRRRIARRQPCLAV